MSSLISGFADPTGAGATFRLARGLSGFTKQSLDNTFQTNGNRAATGNGYLLFSEACSSGIRGKPDNQQGDIYMQANHQLNPYIMRPLDKYSIPGLFDPNCNPIAGHSNQRYDIFIGKEPKSMMPKSQAMLDSEELNEVTKSEFNPNSKQGKLKAIRGLKTTQEKAEALFKKKGNEAAEFFNRQMGREIIEKSIQTTDHATNTLPDGNSTLAVQRSSMHHTIDRLSNLPTIVGQLQQTTEDMRNEIRKQSMRPPIEHSIHLAPIEEALRRINKQTIEEHFNPLKAGINTILQTDVNNRYHIDQLRAEVRGIGERYGESEKKLDNLLYKLSKHHAQYIGAHYGIMQQDLHLHPESMVELADKLHASVQDGIRNEIAKNYSSLEAVTMLASQLHEIINRENGKDTNIVELQKHMLGHFTVLRDTLKQDIYNHTNATSTRLDNMALQVGRKIEESNSIASHNQSVLMGRLQNIQDTSATIQEKVGRDLLEVNGNIQNLFEKMRLEIKAQGKLVSPSVEAQNLMNDQVEGILKNIESLQTKNHQDLKVLTEEIHHQVSIFPDTVAQRIGAVHRSTLTTQTGVSALDVLARNNAESLGSLADFVAQGQDVTNQQLVQVQTQLLELLERVIKGGPTYIDARNIDARILNEQHVLNQQQNNLTQTLNQTLNETHNNNILNELHLHNHNHNHNHPGNGPQNYGGQPAQFGINTSTVTTATNAAPGGTRNPAALPVADLRQLPRNLLTGVQEVQGNAVVPYNGGGALGRRRREGEYEEPNGQRGPFNGVPGFPLPMYRPMGIVNFPPPGEVYGHARLALMNGEEEPIDDHRQLLAIGNGEPIPPRANNHHILAIGNGNPPPHPVQPIRVANQLPEGRPHRTGSGTLPPARHGEDETLRQTYAMLKQEAHDKVRREHPGFTAEQLIPQVRGILMAGIRRELHRQNPRQSQNRLETAVGNEYRRRYGYG